MNTGDDGQDKAVAVLDPRQGRPSASGMARLCLCPGSWRLEQACPPSDESADAAEGTLLHKHMEEGTTPEDAEQAEAVAWCRKMEAELVRHVFGVEPDAVEVEREVRMWEPEGLYSGQADVIFRRGGRVLVLDYKFGRGEVEVAERNHQLAALAVLAGCYCCADEVFAAILQPRASREVPDMVRYSSEGLNSMERFLAERVRAAAQPGAFLAPGAGQCKYCRALAACPAQLALYKRVQADDMAKVRGWELWDGQQKRYVYDVAKLAEKWARAVFGKVEGDLMAHKEAVRAHEADPEKVPHPGESPVSGLALGKGRTSFTVTDAQKAFDVLNRELGVSADEFVKCCKVGISELHKLTHAKLKERGESRTVQDSRILTLTMLAPYGETKTTKGTIEQTN